ncbi:hypothetical protein E6W17_10050 [Streptomyces sp. A1547]|nr:hypothetical protein E6W17_10050 [Streptomyces sp. A1547]
MPNSHTRLRRFLDRELSAGPGPLRESFRARPASISRFETGQARATHIAPVHQVKDAGRGCCSRNLEQRPILTGPRAVRARGIRRDTCPAGLAGVRLRGSFGWSRGISC